MQLVIDPSGVVHTLYDETIDLTTLGSIAIRRASFVEPDASGHWTPIWHRWLAPCCPASIDAVMHWQRNSAGWKSIGCAEPMTRMRSSLHQPRRRLLRLISSAPS